MPFPWLFNRRPTPQPEERSAFANLVAPSYGGERVPPSQADRNTAVSRCVQLISNDLAKVPIRIMRAEGNAKVESSNPLISLLRKSPNVDQSAFEFRRWMTATFLLYGNSYAFIQRNGRDEVLQIIPLQPGTVSVQLSPSTGNVTYNHATMGQLAPEEVLHFRFSALGDDSMVEAYSPIVRARDALGLARSQEKAGASTYKNAATPRMSLSHPGVLSDRSAQRLAEQFSQAHSGPDSAGKAIVLEEGMTAQVLSPLSLESAQWLAAREFSLQEVSRIYAVPTPMIGENSKSTYSNVTQMVKGYIDQCLSHHASMWAAEVQYKLLSPDETLEHDLSFVQRGTFSDEVASLNTAVVSGIMTPNECRARLGFNPIPGGDNLHTMPGSEILLEVDEDDDDRDSLDFNDD